MGIGGGGRGGGSGTKTAVDGPPIVSDAHGWIGLGPGPPRRAWAGGDSVAAFACSSRYAFEGKGEAAPSPLTSGYSFDVPCSNFVRWRFLGSRSCASRPGTMSGPSTMPCGVPVTVAIQTSLGGIVNRSVKVDGTLTPTVCRGRAGFAGSCGGPANGVTGWRMTPRALALPISLLEKSGSPHPFAWQYYASVESGAWPQATFMPAV